MLNDITLPPVVPPLPRDRRHARNLPREAAFDWLRAGWKDYRTNPASSLMYQDRGFPRLADRDLDAVPP